METINLDCITVYDAARRSRIIYNMTSKMLIDGDTKKINEERRKIIDDYSQKKNLEGYCMLSADGAVRLKKHKSLADLLRFDRNNFFEWVYEDNGANYPTQEWINKQDGKYLALLLNVCNPLNLDVQSHSSILFVPDHEYSIFRQAGRQVKAKMFIPGIGYYEDVSNRKTSIKEILWMTYIVFRKELPRALSTPSHK